MSNIKNVMASKYPSKTKKESLQSITPPQPSYSWNNNRVIVVSILLGLVFLMVSLPGSYQATGNFFKFFDTNEFQRVFSFKSSLLHAVIFTIITFIVINIVNSI